MRAGTPGVPEVRVLLLGSSSSRGNMTRSGSKKGRKEHDHWP